MRQSVRRTSDDVTTGLTWGNALGMDGGIKPSVRTVTVENRQVGHRL